MFTLKKTKRVYDSPRTIVAEVDLEGLVCQSLRFNVQVNPWDNMNDPEDPKNGIGEAAGEVFYFES